MSVSNLYNANNDTLYCKELNTNQLVVSDTIDTLKINHAFIDDLHTANGLVNSFSTSGSTSINVGFSGPQPYTLYGIVIGKYAICYFNLPVVVVTGTSGTFNIPYPVNADPPSGNSNNNTAYGNVILFGPNHAASGEGALRSLTVGAHFITCQWECGLAGSEQFFGSFIVNLN